MANSKRKITWILASGSPRRRELLEKLGLNLTIVKPEIDESGRPGEKPALYVQRLSREKARKGWQDWSAAGKKISGPILLIAADTTVVTTRGKILGKPENPRQAAQMLASLAGVEHDVFTGYTALWVANGKSREISRVVRTRVRMRPLTRAQIQAYVKTGEPMDKAGAYAAQGIGSLLVESIRGSYFNVVGLPVSQLIQDLETAFGSGKWSFLKSEKISRS